MYLGTYPFVCPFRRVPFELFALRDFWSCSSKGNQQNQLELHKVSTAIEREVLTMHDQYS